MGDLILIAVGSALVSNVVLSQFLGICSFLGVSKKTETAEPLFSLSHWLPWLQVFCINSFCSHWDLTI